LEVGEAGVAVGAQDYYFAVEDAAVGGKGGDLGGDGLHAVGPVEAGAGEELDFGAVFAGLDAVAVELELVEPAGGGGWGGGEGGELWGDEFGEGLFRGFSEIGSEGGLGGTNCMGS